MYKRLAPRTAVLCGLVCASLGVLARPVTADTSAPNIAATASVVTTGVTNVAPQNPLNNMVEGTSVHLHANIAAGQTGNIYEAQARVCNNTTNINGTSAFDPTEFGNCINAPFIMNVDDDFNDVQTDPPNTAVDIDIRVGVGKQTFSTNQNGTVTITCDYAHPCRVWLNLFTDTTTNANGHVFFHWNLNYARESVTTDGDGDRKSDLAVFRPNPGDWFLHQSTAGDAALNYGTSTDIPVPGDYDGDGRTDIAVFRPSVGLWAIHQTQGTDSFQTFGIPGDIPVPADYDGDGKTDLAVYRAGVWYIHRSGGGGDISFGYGTAEDVPVPGFYDTDNKADIAVFRQSGTWFVHPSTGAADYAVLYGQSGDVPIPADFDGDQHTDISIYRPSTGLWAEHRSSTNSDTFLTFPGLGGEVPLVADFDGDGKADFSMYRPGVEAWLVRRSTDSSEYVTTFGIPHDIPLLLPYAIYRTYFTP